MEFWEFLLQKEGDRSWLPLESSKVEILEGRYRVVARSNRSNMSVEIRIIHDATLEIPPVRRTQKRTGKTNKDGLVVIIPFTKLLPGTWELRCTSDLMSEMLGEGWQHRVQFQVEPQATEADWEADWDSNVNVTAAEAVEISAPEIPLPASANTAIAASENTPSEQDAIAITDAPTEPEPIAPAGASPAADPWSVAAVESSTPKHSDQPETSTLPASASDLLPLTPRTAKSPTQTDPTSEATLDATIVRNSPLFQQAEQASDAVVEAAFDELGAELTPIAHPSSQPVSLPAIRIRLGQDTHVVQRGQPLALVGQIEHAAGLLTDEIAVSELQVRLYDPRNSQVLVDKRQPLTPRRLPFPFSCQVTLPETHQTYLLLGEVVLYAASADTPAEIATQTFTVTTDLHELLETIANDFTEPDLPPPPSASVHADPTPPTVAFLNLPGVSQVSFQFRPSVPQPLPPQLRPIEASSSDRSRKAPELPTFAKTDALQESAEAPMATDAPSIPNDFLVDAILDEEIAEASRQPESPEERPIGEAVTTATSGEAALNEAAPNETSISPQSFANDDPISDWYKDEFLSEPDRPQATVERRSASPEDLAFQSLNLQERFWARLQSLMTDQELSDWLRMSEPGEAMAGVALGSEKSVNDGSGKRGRSRPFSGGADAALASQEVVAEDALYPSTPAAGRTDSSEDASAMLVLPLDQPIPVPQLELVTKELIAGQAFTAAVRLPNLSARLMVKLWLRDRQSRTLLSGPHWLMDFTSDGFGNEIVRIELTVPRGCLEVQMEAITIEVPTQRESDKATLVREVVPPDLSPLSLDDFDI